MDQGQVAFGYDVENTHGEKFGWLCMYVKPYPIDFSAIKRLKREWEKLSQGRGTTLVRDKKLSRINFILKNLNKYNVSEFQNSTKECVRMGATEIYFKVI